MIVKCCRTKSTIREQLKSYDRDGHYRIRRNCYRSYASSIPNRTHFSTRFSHLTLSLNSSDQRIYVRLVENAILFPSEKRPPLLIQRQRPSDNNR